MDPASLAVAAASGLLGAAAGAAASYVGVLRGRALRDSAAHDEQLRAAVDQERRRSARALAEVQHRMGEAEARWRQIALATTPELLSKPVYKDRPSARDLQAIVERLRGLAFVDAVTVADPAGLSAARGEGEAERDLAALVPLFCSLDARIGGMPGKLSSLSIVTADGRYITLRALPRWAGRSCLAVMTAGQRPPAAALDAAVAGASLARPDDPHATPLTPGAAALTLRGATSSVGETHGSGPEVLAELGKAMASLDARGMAFGFDGRVYAACLNDGPSPAATEALFSALQRARAVAARRLRDRDVLRVELTAPDGIVITYVPMLAEARMALLCVTRGHAIDDIEVDRMVGRLRRLSGQLARGRSDRSLPEAHAGVSP
jgi:hypothetical protein